MKPVYELNYRGWWLFGGGLLLALCIVASVVPGARVPALPGGDKLGHAVMYAAIFLWFSGIVMPRHWGILIVSLLLLSGFLEIVQAGVPGRSRETWDLIANAAGLGAGLAVAYSFAAGWCCKLEARLPGRQNRS